MVLDCTTYNLLSFIVGAFSIVHYIIFSLLFTISQKDYNKIKENIQLTVIGHVTEDSMDCNLINIKGEQSKLIAQGWKNFKE